MTHFPTCLGCTVAPETCETLAALKAAISGHCVTTIRFRCQTRVAAFSPGDPVLVETWTEDDEESGPNDHDKVYRQWPGTFIKRIGNKGLAFIKEGTIAHGRDYGSEGVPFRPHGSGTGFVKTHLARIRRAEGERIDVSTCHKCETIPALFGGCKHMSASVRKTCPHHKPVTFLGGAIELAAGQWIAEDDDDDVPF